MSPEATYRASSIVKLADFIAIIEMGDRKIVLRAATGEQGEKGPLPYVEVREGESKLGYCMTRESQFEDLWNFFVKGCR